MKDRFSSTAGNYAAFRPTYPAALYDFIFNRVKCFDNAWDAGTGNGQVARDLSPKFKKIYATDISAKQLEHATGKENIFYSLAGEETIFPAKSIDLITVAQAIHWFDREKFYREVLRVAKPYASIAVWGYGLLRIAPTIDEQLDHFYKEVIGVHWDAERKLIDDHYQSIAFPFEEIATPMFEICVTWTLAELEGYLNTWSAVQHYIKATGENPVTPFVKELARTWADAARGITFPVFLRFGKIRPQDNRLRN